LRQYIRSGLPFGRLVVLHVLVRAAAKFSAATLDDSGAEFCAASQESIGFVPVVVGVLFFLFEFLNDQLLAFMVRACMMTHSVGACIAQAGRALLLRSWW
jgi:hypothetical protein